MKNTQINIILATILIRNLLCKNTEVPVHNPKYESVLFKVHFKRGQIREKVIKLH